MKRQRIAWMSALIFAVLLALPGDGPGADKYPVKAITALVGSPTASSGS